MAARNLEVKLAAAGVCMFTYNPADGEGSSVFPHQIYTVWIRAW